MKVEELMQHIENGNRSFIGSTGRERIVLNAGWAWIEYTTAANPNYITATFTERFAKWAKGPKATGTTE